MKGLVIIPALLMVFVAVPAFSVVLLTPEEAAQEEAREDSGLASAESAAIPATGGTPRTELRFVVPESSVAGPEVLVISPEVDKTYWPPLKIMVKFIPRDGTQVDLSSLKVECLKLLSINITDRVKEYANSQGINVEKAELPSGTHKMRITLGDSGGGITSKVFVVKVQ